MAVTDNLFNKRKIAVLGSRSVGKIAKPLPHPSFYLTSCLSNTLGKSSLVIQFVENVFNPHYFPTIENTFTKQIKYKGREFECDIIDTSGQDEYSQLNSRHSVGVHGYILVYSVANRTSFDMVRTVHDKIITQSGMATIPCVVVGQKSDLADSRYVSHSLCLPCCFIRFGS